MNLVMKLFLFCLLIWTPVSIMSQQATNAAALLSPNSVKAGDNSEEFNYRIVFFNGHADSVAIDCSDLGENVYVTDVRVDNTQYYLMHSSLRPASDMQCTWNFNNVDNSLVLLVQESGISTRIEVTIKFAVPTQSDVTLQFPSSYDDANSAPNGIISTMDNWELDILPNDITNIFIESFEGADLTKLVTDEFTSGSTEQLFAVGRDMYGNFNGYVNSSWSVEGAIGSFSTNNGISVLFNPITVGSGKLSVSHQTFSYTTEDIYVVAGDPVKIKLVSAEGGSGSEIGNISLTVDETINITAALFDDNDNYCYDYDAEFHSTSIDNPVDFTGKTLTFYPQKLSDGFFIYATADHYNNDQTGIITITEGNIRNILICDVSAEPIDTLRNISADQMIELRACGFDVRGNFVDSVEAEWSISSNFGSLLPTSQSINSRSKIFNAMKDTLGTISIEYNEFDSFISGNVVPGMDDHIKIMTGEGNTGKEFNYNLVMTTDDTLKLWSAVFDSDDNYKRDAQATIWNTNGTLDFPEHTGSSFIFMQHTDGVSGNIIADLLGDVKQSGNIKYKYISWRITTDNNNRNIHKRYNIRYNR